ncbi:MAG: hypothetical protein ACREJ3_02605 [Polyangiaceae bacterium]
MMSAPWEAGFAAVSALLGESVDDIVAALGELGSARASEVLRGLCSPTRRERALAIARAVAEVAFAVDAVRLA